MREIQISKDFVKVTEASLLRRRSGRSRSYMDMLEPMRNTVCNRKEKKVCCLSSSSSLPKLGREDPTLECQENPCKGESNPSIPWPGKEGCFPLPADAETSSCYNLVLDENEIRCEAAPDKLGVRGVAVSAGRWKHNRQRILNRNIYFIKSLPLWQNSHTSTMNPFWDWDCSQVTLSEKKGVEQVSREMCSQILKK